MQRRLSVKEAEKAYNKANRSPFIKYCITVVASLLGAGTVFTCLLFATDFVYDAENATFRISTKQPSVTTVTTTVEVVKNTPELPDNSSDSLLAGVSSAPGNTQPPYTPGTDTENYPSYDEGEAYTLTADQQYIYNFFKGKGYNDIAIAAMFGNMEEEHGFSPAYSSNGRIGIIQWGSDRKTNLESGQWTEGHAPDTIEAQCLFIWAEISGQVPGYTWYNVTCNSNALNDPIATCRSKGWANDAYDELTHATYIFAKVYEGCVTGGASEPIDNAWTGLQNFDRRLKYAYNAYKSFKH